MQQRPGIYRLSLGSPVSPAMVTIHLLPDQQFLDSMKTFLWKILKDDIWKVNSK